MGGPTLRAIRHVERRVLLFKGAQGLILCGGLFNTRLLYSLVRRPHFVVLPLNEPRAAMRSVGIVAVSPAYVVGRKTPNPPTPRNRDWHARPHLTSVGEGPCRSGICRTPSSRSPLPSLWFRHRLVCMIVERYTGGIPPQWTH